MLWKRPLRQGRAQRGKLAAAAPRLPLWLVAMRRFGPSPDADEIEAIARASLAALPEPFAAHLADIVLTVEDFADDALLANMGIDDPFDLTGLYHGLPIGDKSVEHSGTCPTASLSTAARSSTNGLQEPKVSSISSTTYWSTKSAIISV